MSYQDHTSRSGRVGSLVAALLLTTVIGCGGYERPAGIPVSGTVTLDGKPVPLGTIVFKPRSAGSASIRVSGGDSAAATIQDGKFTLTETDGPPPGTSDIEVIVQKNLGFDLDDEQAYSKRGGTPVNTKVDFKDPKAKSVEVVAGGPAISIEMITKSVPVARTSSNAVENP